MPNKHVDTCQTCRKHVKTIEIEKNNINTCRNNKNDISNVARASLCAFFLYHLTPRVASNVLWLSLFVAIAVVATSCQSRLVVAAAEYVAPLVDSPPLLFKSTCVAFMCFERGYGLSIAILRTCIAKYLHF